jgi:hypothetical protein
MTDGNAMRASALVDITAACEQVYEWRDTWRENPRVCAAIDALKASHTALIAADAEVTAAGGPFRGIAAAWRAHRAALSTQAAIMAARAAIERASQELDSDLRRTFQKMTAMEEAETKFEMEVGRLPTDISELVAWTATPRSGGPSH